MSSLEALLTRTGIGVEESKSLGIVDVRSVEMLAMGDSRGGYQRLVCAVLLVDKRWMAEGPRNN
jgi:hypothetical protein